MQGLLLGEMLGEKAPQCLVKGRWLGFLGAHTKITPIRLGDSLWASTPNPYEQSKHCPLTPLEAPQYYCLKQTLSRALSHPTKCGKIGACALNRQRTGLDSEAAVKVHMVADGRRLQSSKEWPRGTAKAGVEPLHGAPLSGGKGQ